ncbi:MAG: ABC transporter substrate-binding protein [Saccharofermentanales bacterium]
MSKIKKILSMLVIATMLTAALYGCKPATTDIPSSSGASSEEISNTSSEENSQTSDVSSEETSSEAGSNVDSTASSEANSTTTSSSAITSQNTSITGSKTSSQAVSKPAPTANPNAVSGIVKNMQGRTVVIQYKPDPSEDPTNKWLERLNARLRAVEKQYNCKIVQSTVSPGTPEGNNQIKVSVLAGKPIVDIWWQNGLGYSGSAAGFIPMYVAGLLQPLDNFKCFDFSLPMFNDEPNLLYKINGKRYGISRTDSTSWQVDMMMFYRKDLLTAAGVAPSMMPAVLAKAGKWTWANFEVLAKKVKAAGFVPIANRSEAINAGDWYSLMLYTFGANVVEVNPTTRATTFGGGTTKGLQALALYTRLATEGTIDPKYYYERNGFTARFDNVVFDTGYAYWCRWQYPYSASASAKDHWAMVYPPKVKESDKYTVVADAGLGCFSIPYSVKKPFDAATVLQALTPFENTPAALATQKAEAKRAYTPYLSLNGVDETNVVINNIVDISYTPDQKYTYDNLGSGPRVQFEWLQHVTKIALGEENANTVISANSAKWNNLLKNVWQIR